MRGEVLEDITERMWSLVDQRAEPEESKAPHPVPWLWNGCSACHSHSLSHFQAMQPCESNRVLRPSGLYGTWEWTRLRPLRKRKVLEGRWGDLRVLWPHGEPNQASQVPLLSETTTFPLEWPPCLSVSVRPLCMVAGFNFPGNSWVCKQKGRGFDYDFHFFNRYIGTHIFYFFFSSFWYVGSFNEFIYAN